MWRKVYVALVVAGCKFEPGALRAADAQQDAPVDVAPIVVDAAVDTPPPITVRQDCLAWFQNGVMTSGVRMIDPDGPGSAGAFDAYCDMTTAGGGWTLVWVYGFTNYAAFQNVNNAITPRPTWGMPAAGGTPTSTTVPLTPTSPGALDFAQWAGVGTEIMVQSNINHWIQCQPGVGSLVAATAGSMSCQLVQQVATACTTVLPDRLGTFGNGWGLLANSGGADLFYYWDGNLTNHWPTHDPCGVNAANQLTGVTNPYGAIYLRRQ